MERLKTDTLGVALYTWRKLRQSIYGWSCTHADNFKDSHSRNGVVHMERIKTVTLGVELYTCRSLRQSL